MTSMKPSIHVFVSNKNINKYQLSINNNLTYCTFYCNTKGREMSTRELK